jgi:hypothetical protein
MDGGSGQLQDPAALTPGKEHLLFNRLEVWWATEPVWTLWWREKFPAPAGTQTPVHPARTPVLYNWTIPALITNV